MSSDLRVSLMFALFGLPRTIAHGAIFAGLLLVGLRISRSAEAMDRDTRRVDPARFVGSYAALQGVAVTMICAARVASELGLLGYGVMTASFGTADRLAAQRDALITLGVALLPALAAGIILLVFIHRIWSAIQDGHTKPSPGKAVGLLFVPFFNFYWVFVVFGAYPRRYEAFARRHGLSSPLLGSGLFIAGPALVLVASFLSLAPFGFVLLLPAYVVIVAMLRGAADAVNALPAQSLARPATV